MAEGPASSGASDAPAPQSMTVAFAGRRLALFWMLIWTAVVTVATFGLYRFWARTRVRRYIWSAGTADGDPLEYNGSGLEKFMGFSIAVVILAVYLAVAQILVTFAGFSLLGEFDPASRDTPVVNEPGVFDVLIWGSTLLLLLPAITFAQYRAARYTAARTRWRGIRFAMDPAAGAYTWRASFLWLCSIFTLGLFYPFQVMLLTRFRVNRLSFGTARFRQAGPGYMLFRPYLPLLLGTVGVIALLSSLILLPGMSIQPGPLSDVDDFPIFAALAIGFALTVGILLLPLFGFAHARAHSFRRLMNARQIEGRPFAHCTARVWRVFGYYVTGVVLCCVVLFAFLAVVFGLAEISTFEDVAAQFFELLGVEEAAGPAPRWVFVAAALLYLLLLLTVTSTWSAFVELPTLAYLARCTTILHAAQIATISQRPEDQIADADGFADALDFGGGF